MTSDSKPREFWIDRVPEEKEFNDRKILCKEPKPYDGNDAWWDFSKGIHVIEKSHADKLSVDLAECRKRKDDILTSLCDAQDSVKLLKSELAETQKHADEMAKGLEYFVNTLYNAYPSIFTATEIIDAEKALYNYRKHREGLK